MICRGKTQSGPCRARVQSGSRFCFFHDPESRERRQEAQRKGGSRKALIPAALPAFDLDYSKLENIPPMIALVNNMMLSRQLDAKTGHAVFHGIDTALRVHSLSALKRQMDKVERLLEAERNRHVDQSDVDELLRFEPDPLEELEEQLKKVGESAEDRTSDCKKR